MSVSSGGTGFGRCGGSGSLAYIIAPGSTSGKLSSMDGTPETPEVAPLSPEGQSVVLSADHLAHIGRGLTGRGLSATIWGSGLAARCPRKLPRRMTGMPKKYGFALIGCGAVGAHHVTAISQLRNARLVAVCDVFEASALRCAERAGVPWFTDYHEMLERDDVDIVNVCTPSGLHMEPALAAMASGKHCVVEKPL
ncbi:MAG: Gfo/Idh/MocA family oxidoreductase, partial [Planctomycetes bacterium]|nr:Gfo/Idh/MocA family oxidoreductase [Planctomycetota bacterium]